MGWFRSSRSSAPALLGVAALALAACSGAPLTRAATAGPPSGAAAGDVAGPIDIGGGRRLYLECRGSGGPTIVLESGYHDSSDPWSLTDAAAPAVPPAVLPGLAADHRVCAYDRPGTLRYTDPPTLTDRSTPVPMPRTARDVVADLHALLAAAQVPGPYVLVAHSLGGLFARLYAQTHPDQVRAVLFVDSFPAELPAMFGAQWPNYQALLDRPVPQFADDPAFERVDIDASVAQVEAAPPLPAVPLAVLTKTQPFPLPADAPAGLGQTLDRLWPEAAQKLVALQPQTPQTFATGSDHYIQVHQPDLVIRSIELLITRAAGER